ncbi:MAG: DNA-binding protein [Candidatus Thermoplasmatota archaeon]|nr:DNA-binding protein [Candidatus Thermoplasmatota archaeon]
MGISDEDAELEMIRRRKLADLQTQQVQEENIARQQEHLEEQRMIVLRRILTKEAMERLGNLSLAYPEVTENIKNQLLMLYQSGRIQREIDDDTLKKLLQQVQPRSKEIKITRK